MNLTALTRRPLMIGAAAAVLVAAGAPAAQAAPTPSVQFLLYNVRLGIAIVGPSGPTVGPDYVDGETWGIGDTVKLDASPSTAASGVITRYEWDLDGNGSFETTGSPKQSVTFTKVGSLTVSLRVTDSNGGIGLGSVQFTRIVVGSPPGDVGISINAGAQFTNTPHVHISLVWPVGTPFARLSNDGGFTDSKQFDVVPTVPWTLQSSGPERLPKTVYARYAGTTISYTDDIILDETPPAIEVSLAGAAMGASASAAGTHTYRLKIKASDKTSGVARMQITSDKKKPGKVLRYSTRATFKAPKSTVYVRAQDRAGNYSRWRTAK